MKGVFISDNIVNISGRQFSNAEISLLSKGLKFVPTPTYVDRSLLKQDIEKFARKLRLKWHFRNNRNDSTTYDRFRKKTLKIEIILLKYM